MSSEMRRITDPKAVRGLAHPLRWRILELLQTEGPMTATEVSDIVGESPANCSFHLRTLGKYGFIEEVGTGKGRSRPWQAMDFSMEVDESELSGPNREANLVVGMLYRQAASASLERWVKDQNHFSSRWRKAAFDIRRQFSMTAVELAELNEEIGRLLDKYQNRDDIPDDALQISLAAWGFPVEDAERRRRRLKKKS